MYQRLDESRLQHFFSKDLKKKRGQKINYEEFEANPIWPILVETVQKMILYKNHLAYIRDHVLPSEPKITANELAQRLEIPLGEALVILWTLEKEKHKD